jgi:excisionase family DNA binding protein
MRSPRTTTTEPKPSALRTVPSAAAHFDLPARILREAIEEGEIDSFRFGRRWLRVRLADVETWIQAHRLHAAERQEGDAA